MQQLSYVVLVIFILIFIAITLYVLWLTYSVVAIRDILLSPVLLDNATKSLGTIRDIFLSLLEIVLIVALIYSLYLLWHWIRNDDNEVFIHPFIIGACDGKYDGAAISDLLIAELLKIQSIHKVRKMAKENGQIEELKESFISQAEESKKTSGQFDAAPSDTSFTLSPFAPSSMNFA